MQFHEISIHSLKPKEKKKQHKHLCASKNAIRLEPILVSDEIFNSFSSFF